MIHNHAASQLHYPREDSGLDDLALLVGAIGFSTAQRAFEAESLFERDVSGLSKMEAAFLAVTAFGQRVTSTEDALGWMFALRDWQPGTAKGSLLYLLNRINVGRGDHTDAAAIDYLSGCSQEEFRRGLHIPTEAELAEASYPEEFRAHINASNQAVREGMLGMARFRAEEDGTRVAGYNKAKHFMLGRLVGNTEAFHVELVDARIRRRGQEEGWELKRVTVLPNAAEAQRDARRAFANQAVLNTLLGTVAITRFGFAYESPTWVQRALENGIWADDAVPSEAQERG